MTSICRGLNVGDGKSWVAARMVVTLGTSELGDDTLGATPTPVSYTHLTLPTNREV